MHEIHWARLPLHRSSPRTREYLTLLGRVEARLLSNPPPSDHSSAPALDLLDQLASFLNTPLLPGDTFALESELLHLLSHTHSDLGGHQLVAATRSHLHLLRYQPSVSGPGQLEGWLSPLKGVPLGISPQPVGFLGAQEIVLLARDGNILRESRLALSTGQAVSLVHVEAGESAPLTALGRNHPGLEVPLQIEVRRVPDVDAHSYYQTRARRHPSSPWKTVHTARHPLQNPFFDGSTLFFTARSSELVALPAPLDTPTPTPRTIITLDTPSPILALLRYPAGQGHTLLAATADGTLFAIDPNADRLRWKFDTAHSLAAVAFDERLEGAPLAIGTPDGLLELFHPVDSAALGRQIDALLHQTCLPLERLLELSVDGDPARERPYLRLLALDRLFESERRDAAHLGRIRDGLLQAFGSASRGGRLAPAEVIRFLSYQCYRLSQRIAAQDPASRAETAASSPYIALVFSVLETLAPLTHGDARRRLERLLRRLRNDWLDPGLYEHYRSQHAPSLTLQSLAAHSLRHDAVAQLKRAEDTEAPERKLAHLLKALASTWRRYLTPLNRSTSLQGVTQAVRVSAGPEPGLEPSSEAASNQDDSAWLVGLSREGLQIYRLHPELSAPDPTGFYPLNDGIRLASGPLLESHSDVVAVARVDRVSVLRFHILEGLPQLSSLPIADLRLDEPVTALELLEIPSRESSRPFIPALAVGQADGRIRLFVLEPREASSEEDATFRYRWHPVLDIHRPAPVHHVAIYSWPEWPALIISADPQLHIYHDVHLDGHELQGTLEVLELESAVTAFTVAWPPPRKVHEPRPILIIGLANGLVQAFQPAPTPGDGPELCWHYRAPQVITDLAYLPDPTGGWFVAAADDGELHLLRYGEPHHRVTVERYPFDVTPILLPWALRPNLLVGSPAGAVSLLEISGASAANETATLIERLERLVPESDLPQLLVMTKDTALLALAIHLLRRHPLDALLAFAETHQVLTHTDPALAQTLLAVLLNRAPQEPLARARAYEFLQAGLGSSSVPNWVKVHLLQTLGASLDRIEEPEIDLILSPVNLEEPVVARAYLEMLEHLWIRFREVLTDDLLWWRGVHRLGVGADQFDRRHLQPAIGTFARKLLNLDRNNVLARIRHVRDLEDRGLYLARLVCEALSLPHVLGDPVTRRCVSQYARLLHTQGAAQLHEEMHIRRDLLEELDGVVADAHETRQLYDDILETFEYNDYDQYSGFLVDAPEFLPRARAAHAENATLLQAFGEVRSKLTAAAPPPTTDRDRVTQFRDRVQTLGAQADVLADFIRRWSTGATLEQQIVAAALHRWRERILQPEIRRLQDAVELSVRELRVVLPEDGGLAEVTARIHNLGGRSLEGLTVGLYPGPKDNYLWEGTAEWCQGPLSYGKSIEYRTDILLEENVADLSLAFEIRFIEQGQEAQRILTGVARIEREEGATVAPGLGRFREEMPATFDALRQTLVRSDSGRLLVLQTEEVREREQLVTDLATVLGEGVDPSRRVVLSLDLPGMLEGPPRATNDELPAWWLPDRLARTLAERGLLTSMPERVELRADPRAALDRVLHRALESVGELWIALRRATRAFASHTPTTIEQARDWLQFVLEHPSHRVRVLIGADFALAARLSLPPSPLASRVDLLDVDHPYPFESPKSRAEHLHRVHGLLAAAKVYPSELVRNKLLANTGYSLPLLRRLIARLEPLRAESWIQWQRKVNDQQGEPEELDRFLHQCLAAISRPLKEPLRALPFFHRLTLAAVAAGKISLARKDLREGMILSKALFTEVRQRGNRPKRLYAAHAVMLEGDVNYLQVTVGEVQGGIEVGLFRSPDYSVSLSYLLAVLGLPRLLADLEKLGLVRHQTHSSITSWTIASPLLRRWLVTAHPFEPGTEADLRKRLAEDVNVAEIMPLAALVELNTRLSSSRRLTDFLVFLGLVDADQRKGSPALEAAFRRWERLLNLARKAQAWRIRPGLETFRALIQEWAAQFGCLVDLVDFELDEGFFGVSIDLSPLKIPRLSNAAVFGLTRELTALQVEKLREAVRKAATLTEGDIGDLPTGVMGFTLLPEVLASTEDPSAMPVSVTSLEAYRDLLGDRLVPLIERDLISAILADDGRRAFLDLLARGGFRFQHLSPYHLLGPLKGRAMDVLFVGRADEIDDMLRHPDQQFAIVGSRKIGKTSLLLKLKQELTQHLGEKARVHYIDCATLTPTQTWRSITDGLKLQPVHPDEARLGLRRQLEPLKHPVVLLLDEIDGLYDAPGLKPEESAERLMWDLRSLAAAGVLRLILAGYVRVYERRLDPRSAFHNFTTFRKLGALTTDAARTLVRNPMSSLDIEIASEGLIDLILERTYRVPWIMQLFCHQLIMKLDDRLERSRRFDRRILREDVDGVSVQIEEELYTHFTSARVMSVTEQVLLLTMVEAGVSNFSEEDLRDRLETRFGEDIWLSIRYEDLPRMLDNLTLTLALTVENGAYAFPLEMYPTVVRSRLGDVRPRLERLRQKLARDAG